VALHDVTVNKVKFLDRSGMRGMVRLLALHGRMPAAEWVEYQALQTNRTIKIKDPYFVEVLALNASILKRFVNTKVSEEGIGDLYCAVRIASFAVSVQFELRTIG
jgi:hypothetical protein